VRTTLFLALLAAAALAGLLAVEQRLPDLVRRQLQTHGYDDLLAFESLELPSPERVVVRGASLRDLVTGEPTAWLDHLEIRLDGGLAEGRAPELLAIEGRAGRCLLRQGPAGEEMTFVRVLIALIERILEQLGGPDRPHDPDRRLPPMTFTDLDVAVHAPGWPVTRLSGVRATVRDDGEATRVVVDPPDQGELRMAFDRTGMRSLHIDGLRADPALIHVIPYVGPYLAEGLQPEGRVDVTVLVDRVPTPDDPDGEVVVDVDGSATDLVLRSPWVPVPLGPMVTRFRYAHDELHVDDAIVQLPGGSLRASIGGPLTDLDVRLSVHEAEFRRWMIELVPGLRDVDLLRIHDGGAFDLDLTLEGFDVEGEAKPRVRGQGGFHVRRTDVLTPGAPLELRDVVGRFEIDDVELIIPRLSARVAGGNVTGEGTLLLDALTYDTTLRVEDVDVARLHPTLHGGRTPHALAGWLQGEATLFGVLDGESLPNAFGQASVRAADLWDTPLIEALLLALPDDIEESRGRQRVEASFSTGAERVNLDSIRIASEVFTLTAEGAWIGFDGRLFLNGSVFQVPFGFVGRAVQLLADQLLLKVEVRGSLDDPRVTPVPLPVVTGPIRSLFRAVGGLFSDDGAVATDTPRDG